MCAFMPAAVRRGVAALALTMILIAPALAQDQPSELNAVTGVAPPFVVKQGDELTGFSIDLWNEIAARLNVKTHYEVAPNVAALLDMMQATSTDVVVAPIFYTVERDRKFDFSHPILEAGLQVLVRGAGENVEPTPLKDVLALIFSRSAVIWLGVGLIIVLIPAHVIWLLDRGNEDGASPEQELLPRHPSCAGLGDHGAGFTGAAAAELNGLHVCSGFSGCSPASFSSRFTPRS